MISVAEADRIIGRLVPLLPSRIVPLAEASGAVLAEDVTADRALPPFDRVALDGIAVRWEEIRSGLRSFRVEGMQRAGEPADRAPRAGGCIEAMTGAVLPAGTDTIVPVEDVTIADGIALLQPGVAPRAGMHVHRAGSDSPAGAVLLRAGDRLGAARIGIAAAVGRRALRVGGRPRVGLVSTGDELVDVAGEPAIHQIRRSNAAAIRAALATIGVRDIVELHVEDDEAVLLERIGAVLPMVDVLVLSGGVSRGRFDLVPAVLTALGVVCRFHGVRQKPGKPLWFGTTADGRRAVFGLPGNPVAALVCTFRWVLPALRRAGGECGPPKASREAVLSAAVPAPAADATLFVPVAVTTEAGRLLAAPVPTNGSGDFCALAGTDGFVEVRRDCAMAGSVVDYHDWRT